MHTTGTASHSATSHGVDAGQRLAGDRRVGGAPKGVGVFACAIEYFYVTPIT